MRKNIIDWVASWVLSSSKAVTIVIGSSFALAASAATAPTNIINNADSVVSLLCVGLNWMFYILIVLSIIMVLIAAYIYLTSNGEPEKVNKATKTLTYVAIAIVVAILAKGVPVIIGDILGAPR